MGQQSLVNSGAIDKVNKVFVYGTLKKGFMRERMLEGSKFLGKDTMRGYLITGGWGYPALVLEELAPLVHGEVYEISLEIRAHLDRIEGVPHLYHRVAVRTFRNLVAWTYLMPQDSLRPSVHRVVSTGEWIGSEGGSTLTWFLNEHAEYRFPKRPKMTYDQSVGIMTVSQKYNAELVKEQLALPRDPTVIVTAPPRPALVVPPEPPYGDEDGPMPGVGIEWADKPKKAAEVIIPDNTEVKDNGI